MGSTSISLPPPAERSQNWLELPPELMLSILGLLDAFDILMNARKVCKTWRRICSDPSMWWVVDLRNSGQISRRLFKNMVRQAVDLSSGQLVQLDIELDGRYDNLLTYIFDRLSQLRRLYLASCSKITYERLSEILIKLPLLEELHLDCTCKFKHAIEIAGRCCPQLKSLKLVNTLYMFPKMGCDEDALAIAENMPGLHHLQLFGPNKVTSDGLLAIVENCPHLQSLDMCLNLSVANLGPDLVRRLSLQIKDLKLSYDSAEESDPLDSFDEDEFGPSDVNSVSDDYEDDSSGLSDIYTDSDD